MLGQGFSWGHHWISSASHAQGVGSGRDTSIRLCYFTLQNILKVTIFLVEN